MKIAISTDTSCLMNDYSIKKYPIFVLPLNVIIDGEEYLDGVTINQEKLLLDGVIKDNNKYISKYN